MPGWMGRGVVMPLSPVIESMAVAGALLVRVGLGAANDRPALAKRTEATVENFILMRIVDVGSEEGLCACSVGCELKRRHLKSGEICDIYTFSFRQYEICFC
jgi:hypothetical protein